MQFYHESDSWLFGGVYRVLPRHDDCYDVQLTERGKDFLQEKHERFAGLN